MLCLGRGAPQHMAVELVAAWRAEKPILCLEALDDLLGVQLTIPVKVHSKDLEQAHARLACDCVRGDRQV